jgi:ABC-type sugar transport system ATPase subunit
VTNAVDCVDLSYDFGPQLAVDHINLEIAPGEMYGLLGPNGAGKTTTIKMLTTLLKPATGTVRVFGIDAAARPMIVRRVIGYVPQALSADANLTGVENVELFARLFDVPRRTRKQRVDDALEAMGLPAAAGRHLLGRHAPAARARPVAHQRAPAARPGRADRRPRPDRPLSYEVEALRGLLIGTATTLWLDTVVLVGATIVAITCASLLLPRLANR